MKTIIEDECLKLIQENQVLLDFLYDLNLMPEELDRETPEWDIMLRFAYVFGIGLAAGKQKKEPR